MVKYTFIDSLVGSVRVAWSEQGLVSVCLGRELETHPPREDWEHTPHRRSEAADQLLAYFEGRLRRFHLPLVLAGTAFQKRVWHALADIPYGETVSYSELASAIGAPTAVRAVGAANGRNPLPIVLPCHRVIGKNGRLTGYGGGLDAKAALLRFERGIAGWPLGGRSRGAF